MFKPSFRNRTSAPLLAVFLMGAAPTEGDADVNPDEGSIAAPRVEGESTEGEPSEGASVTEDEPIDDGQGSPVTTDGPRLAGARGGALLAAPELVSHANPTVWLWGSAGLDWWDHVEAGADMAVFLSHAELGAFQLEPWLTFRPQGWDAYEGLHLRAFLWDSGRAPYLGLDPRRLSPGAEGSRSERNPDPDPFLRVGHGMPHASHRSAWGLSFARQGFEARALVRLVETVNELTNETELLTGTFGGVGWSPLPNLSLDVDATFLPHGLIPFLAATGLDRPAWTAAAYARARLYLQNPDEAPLDLDRSTYGPWTYEPLLTSLGRPKDGLEVRLEGVGSLQQLENPDEVGFTTEQSGWGAALKGRMAHGGLRVEAIAMGRSTSLLQVDAIGFPPFRAFPVESQQTPELSGEVAADWTLGRWRPSLRVRVVEPAAFAVTAIGLGGNTPTPGSPTPRWVVLRPGGLPSVLPEGSDPRLLVRTSGALEWEPLTGLNVAVRGLYEHDPNQVRYVDDPMGDAQAVFDEPNVYRLDLFVQLAL